MNWSALKDFCNNLPKEELDKNVVLWREDEAITNIEAEQLEEDHYIKKDSPEDGCFPCSQCDDLPTTTKIKRVYKRGQAILHEIF